MQKEVGVPVKWKQVEDSNWYEVETSENYKYYYNKETKETRWDKPLVEKEKKQQIQETKHIEIPKEDLDGYKELVKSLNLPNDINYEQSIPKLLFDQRYKKIPQTHRKKLFNQFRKELMEEKNSSIEMIKRIEETKKEEQIPEKKRKVEDKIKEKGKDNKNKQYEQESQRKEHLRKMAENNFMNLLHEKIKMPYKEGQVKPLEEEILKNDPRFNNDYLENKNYIYKKFTRDFLKQRLELFESKLGKLDSKNMESDLEEVVNLVGSKLFYHMPKEDLMNCLKRWKEEKKKELVESFKKMLRESLHYREGRREENLEYANFKLKDDERYMRLETFRKERDRLILERLEELKEIHRSSKVVLEEED